MERGRSAGYDIPWDEYTPDNFDGEFPRMPHYKSPYNKVEAMAYAQSAPPQRKGSASARGPQRLVREWPVVGPGMSGVPPAMHAQAMQMAADAALVNHAAQTMLRSPHPPGAYPQQAFTAPPDSAPYVESPTGKALIERLKAAETGKAELEAKLRDENERLKEREREAREEAIVRREQERAQAEVSAMLAGQQRFVAALQEEHKREREAREAREAASRAELVELRVELRAEREARERMKEREQQAKRDDVAELKAMLLQEREEAAKRAQALEAEVAELRIAAARGQSIGGSPMMAEGTAVLAADGGSFRNHQSPAAQDEGLWLALRALLENGRRAEEPVGEAAAFSVALRDEAARKLISNHVNVVKDVCNPSAVQNIHQSKMLTQLELKRLPVASMAHVDGFLREVARRLLGGPVELEVRPAQDDESQATAWMQAAAYLAQRLQTSSEQAPGRNADMGPAAGAAMTAVMMEIANGLQAWHTLRALLDGRGKTGAEAAADDPLVGAAAACSATARDEAAHKLISNHVNVVKDVCNPSAVRNIHGNRMLTQLELERVAPIHAPYVDQFLREVARRLLGGACEVDVLEARLKLDSPYQAMAWIQAASYLSQRLQTAAEQVLGRKRDMGGEASEAMIAVMAEVADSARNWLTLWQLLGAADGASAAGAEGVAATHSREACKAAAHKLIANHSHVRLDICNPYGSRSIKGNKLTQARSLIRLPYADVSHVDIFLREVARRLLGTRTSAAQLQSQLTLGHPAQARSWVAAARYFSQRIQSTPQESPGREPDMAPDAAEALRGVVVEVGEMAATHLADLKARGLDVATPPVATPAAATRAMVATPPLHPKTQQRVRPTKDGADHAPLNSRMDVLAAAANALPMPAASTTSSSGAAEASLAMRTLTQGKDSAFQKWLGSKASAVLLDSWNEMLLQSLSTPEALAACAKRHFGPYQMPADMGGYLLGICVLAESLPLAFVLSDAQTAGFPLIFINKKFTDVTGYTKEDCYGRNCRFLQGPATNPEHGKMLLDTLRNGQDSQIMMVNYRKSGQVFENLLTMAYLRDAHGRRRYCVGLQLDLTGLETDDGPWGQEALSSDGGRSLIEETRKKYAMLIKLLPQTLPVPTPKPPVPNREATSGGDYGGKWSCAQLEALAAVVGAPMPPGHQHSNVNANWISVLYKLLDQSSHAVLVVDMSVPGLPLDYANAGFTTLTEWPVEEAVGKNCRFMQDERTEPLALYQLITAIRTYQPLSVQITNVKRCGTAFVNDLSLHPIMDSNGTCRFVVAIQADAAHAAADAATLTALRRAIPSTPVDAALFPKTPPKFEPVPPLEQWREWQKVNTKLIRLLWATEPDGALRQLLTAHPAMAQQAIASFTDYLTKNERAADLALLAKIVEQQRAGSWSPLAGRTAM